jgi:hypothetical protein
MAFAAVGPRAIRANFAATPPCSLFISSSHSLLLLGRVVVVIVIVVVTWVATVIVVIVVVVTVHAVVARVITRVAAPMVDNVIFSGKAAVGRKMRRLLPWCGGGKRWWQCLNRKQALATLARRLRLRSTGTAAAPSSLAETNIAEAAVSSLAILASHAGSTCSRSCRFFFFFFFFFPFFVCYFWGCQCHRRAAGGCFAFAALPAVPAVAEDDVAGCSWVCVDYGRALALMRI